MIHIGDGKFTTKIAIELEHQNIATMLQQKGKCEPIVSLAVDRLSDFLEKNLHSRDALKILLNSHDRFMVIHSGNENAQHKLLSSYHIATLYAKKYIIGPTREFAEEFASKLNVNNGSSFDGFIYYTNTLLQEHRNSFTNNTQHVWFVLRSHMLSNKQLHELQNNAIALNARIILLGDPMQRAKANIGAPLLYLLENGVLQVNLGEQQINSHAKVPFRNGQDLIQTMIKNNHFVANSERDARLLQAVEYIVANDGHLIVQNNADKYNANIAIRQHKQSLHQLTGKSLQSQVLLPIYLSKLQKENPGSFQIGDLLRFNHTIAKTSFKIGSYFEIIDVELHNNKLILTKENESAKFELTLNEKVTGAVAIFRRHIREFQVGDQLVWKDNTPRKLQFNREFVTHFAKVIGVDDYNNIKLLLPSSRILELNLNNYKYQHLEYAYCNTLMEATKKNYNNAALLLNTNSYPKLTLSDVYTALSSIKGNKKIFCNDLAKFQQMIANNPGINEHAFLKTAVNYTNTIKQENFITARGAIDGTLARHHELLKKIVPELKLEHTKLSIQEEPHILQALNAVDFAIAKLSEREAVFKKEDLLVLAKEYDILCKPELIDKAVDQALKEGVILERNLGTLVTKEIYAMECACLKIQKQGEGILPPIITGPSVILDQVKDHQLFTDAQKQAILLAVTTNDRISLIQGVAGSGKTTMLKEVKAIAREAGFELVGVANTASAKNNLQIKTTGEKYNINDPSTFRNAGIDSQTLASFIIQAEKLIETDLELAKETYNKNTVFVLDEASLVSVRDMFAFVNVVEQLDCRAIIIGDDRQLPAIEASRIFKLMLGKSNSYVAMNINTRLKNAEALSIMQDVYAVRIDDAFEKLQDRIVEIPDRAERLSAMANYYLSADQKTRLEMMPMLPLNDDRVAFNTLVREGLKKEGTLIGKEIEVDILVPKDLTHPELTYALGFERGNLIKFNHNINRLGIQKGDYLVVLNRNNNRVILFDEHKNITTGWVPGRFAAYCKGAVEVYNLEKRKLMIGDEIRWRRNDETRGIVNSEIAKIVNIQEQTAKIELNNGQIIEIDLLKKENQHWDHAYGSTVHVVQGLDRRSPIGHGVGASPIEKKLYTVAVDDSVFLAADPDNNRPSRVAKVIEKNNDLAGKSCIKVLDKFNNEYIIDSKTVFVYPKFHESEAPKISSLESFLVMATRGDELTMFVDNIDGYKAALEANKDLKKTALEIMLPKTWEQISEKVSTITGTVYGLAKDHELNNKINGHEQTGNKVELTIKEPERLKKFNEVHIKNTHKTQSPKKVYDVDSIKRALEQDLLHYVSHWKGEPSKKTGREARWGKQGSFSVVLSGSKQGTWADFESGVAGKDPISLYMHLFKYTKSDFSKVLDELASVTGIGNKIITSSKITEKSEQNNEKKIQEEAQAKKIYITKVNKLYNKSLPIVGTLGEVYIKRFREIKGNLPTDFRFHPRCWHDELKTYRPALIVPGYDKNGNLQAVNRIYLNKDGSKLKEQYKDLDGKLQQATAKRNYGPTLGTTIIVNSAQQKTTTYISEGLENALSILQVKTDAEVLASFGVGQLKNLNISPQTNTVVLCADHDGNAISTKGPVLDAVQKWLEQGYQVKIALPFANNITAKYDFNDLLKHKGDLAVSKCLSDAVVINKISDLGLRTTPLVQDFLKLNDRKELDKSINTDDIRNNQQALNKQMQAGLER